MIKQIKKSTLLNIMADDLYNEMFNMKISHAIENCTCVECNQSAKSFDSKSSQKEYFISGLCQRCQDKLFHG